MYFPFERVFKNKSAVLLAGILLGLLLFGGLRAAMIKDDSTHYHANFGLFINGQRDKFDSFTFYEEVQSCADAGANPRQRVHMHDNVNNIVHVHDENVTWGAFFANLGYGLTDDALQTDDDAFVDGQNDRQLHFILNGEDVDSVANRVVGNEDVLLVSYGPKNVDLDLEYNQIRKDAAEYNSTPDPAACAGQESLDFSTRIKRAFNLRS
jgi:hypothetical protein